jgi:hypothetical protein
LKQKEDLNGTIRPGCPKPLFVGTKTFMKFAKIRNAFLIYALPSPNVEPHPHEIPSQYQEFNNVIEKKMQTPYPSTNNMTAPLILKKERNLHSNPSTICHKTNL